MKKRMQTFFNRLTGLSIYRTLPRGVDPLADIRRHLPRVSLDVIFDVGANIGQSVTEYTSRLPHARVYCFEPGRTACDRLREHVGDNPNVRIFQLALGSTDRRAYLVVKGDSGNTSYLLHSEEHPDLPTEDVEVRTLDGFCEVIGIGHIDLLKIDTEGTDLDVLRGAQRMLGIMAVDLVQVEAGMHPGNARHSRFEDLKAFLETKGYLLFALYEQAREWPTGEPHLRRTNPLFISRAAIATNTALGTPEEGIKHWPQGNTTGAVQRSLAGG